MKYIPFLVAVITLAACQPTGQSVESEEDDYVTATKAKWNEWYGDTTFVFGSQPNLFYRAVIDTLPAGKALFPAEGEGRNAVYAATQDWEVDAFDLSESGRNKALRLAQENSTTINYFIADFADPNLRPESYDLVALTYAHVPSTVRQRGHQKVIEAMKPGGVVVLEAFSEKHADSEAAFGPKTADELYSAEEIRSDFAELTILYLEETEVTLDEGFHQGKGQVVRMVARKGELPQYIYSVEELSRRMESPERAQWQKPDEIIEKLGDINGKTVVDLGSGTGYFTFRLIERGAHVIAADPDTRFLDYLKQRRRELSIPSDQLVTRSIPYNSPALRSEEADMLFTVNTYQMIDNRRQYLTEVYQGLKPRGKLVIVTFKNRTTPNGPPAHFRLSPEAVRSEVTSAGFQVVETDTLLLPENYMVIATKPE